MSHVITTLVKGDVDVKLLRFYQIVPFLLYLNILVNFLLNKGGTDLKSSFSL